MSKTQNPNEIVQTAVKAMRKKMTFQRSKRLNGQTQKNPDVRAYACQRVGYARKGEGKTRAVGDKKKMQILSTRNSTVLHGRHKKNTATGCGIRLNRTRLRP